jgi:hypothetical protein
MNENLLLKAIGSPSKFDGVEQIIHRAMVTRLNQIAKHGEETAMHRTHAHGE